MSARLTSAAQTDLREALRWYRGRGARLHRRFLQSFYSAVEAISRHPALGPTVEGEVRFLLPDFPYGVSYGVFYLARAEDVVILGLLHGAPDPTAWPADGAA